ncbi:MULTISPECIES: hypothetical protein [Phenylobacterium]|uniref:Uncharacterized protein n=1 Tax=Phenylobacterium haematophilum TaxID=98513 RepID=A0A840A5R3_9CAUL|nr:MULTISPECIES: hypothetical protein [Phenylobacterium]MBB3892811.1 hypothetical protein [Phenylobacterium haematophilum]
MSERLDELLNRLAASPADRSLDGLETEIGRRIAARRRDARALAALAPVRFASVSLALAMGLTAGGAVAASAALAPQHDSPLSSAARLAPSNLLEGRR